MVPNTDAVVSLGMESEFVLSQKTRACKELFQKCLHVTALSEDDWLEQKCAEFNWWTSGLNADRSGLGSLDSRLRLRPDVKDIVADLLDGLMTALSKCDEIASSSVPSLEEQLSRASDSDDRLSTHASDAVERSPSPWSDMTEGSGSRSGSPAADENLELDHDPYKEQRYYIETNLEILIRIHTAIKRSGLKFRNQRADDALKKAEDDYQLLRATVGEHRALYGSDTHIGEHERFRRFLTKLVLRRGYNENLIQRMARNIQILTDTKGGSHLDVLVQKKLMIIFRAYFDDPARLKPVQRRLIEANVVRRNRLIHAGRVAKIRSQTQTDQIHDSRQKPMVMTAVQVLANPSPSPQMPSTSMSKHGKGKSVVRSVVTQPATALASDFTISGALAPPAKTAKSAATKMSARVANLDYPKCPTKEGPFECMFCPAILSQDYTEKKRWRAHVAQDLNPYICVFEDCQSPDDMYASTYEWMSHMARFHCATEWVCLKCTKHSMSGAGDASTVSFDHPAQLKDHILASHPGVEPSELDFLMDASKRSAGIQKVRCPLCLKKVGLVMCNEEGEDSFCLQGSSPEIGMVQLEDDEHIANHIHEFALQSLPWYVSRDKDMPEASLSHSTSSTQQKITFQPLPDFLPTPRERQNWYSLDDVLVSIENIRAGVSHLGHACPRGSDVHYFLTKFDQFDSRFQAKSTEELDLDRILLALNEIRLIISQLHAATPDHINQDYFAMLDKLKDQPTDLLSLLDDDAVQDASIEVYNRPGEIPFSQVYSQEDFFPNGQVYGLQVLRDPIKPLVDIIFVHGLSGNSYSTWVEKESGIYWPVQLLSKDVPEARIMTFRYDVEATKLLGTTGQQNFLDHALILIGGLAAERPKGDSDDRKIVFIVHSLGGLLIKQALCLSEQAVEPELQQLNRCTTAVAFLGTPHGQSDPILFFDSVRNILKAVGMGDDEYTFRSSNFETLADVEKSFSTWLQQNNGRVNVTCFYEELQTPKIGVVVPRESAMISGFPLLSIHANHTGITKFRTSDDIGYKLILSEVKRWPFPLANSSGEMEELLGCWREAQRADTVAAHLVRIRNTLEPEFSEQIAAVFKEIESSSGLFRDLYDLFPVYRSRVPIIVYYLNVILPSYCNTLQLMTTFINNDAISIRSQWVSIYEHIGEQGGMTLITRFAMFVEFLVQIVRLLSRSPLYDPTTLELLRMRLLRLRILQGIPEPQSPAPPHQPPTQPTQADSESQRRHWAEKIFDDQPLSTTGLRHRRDSKCFGPHMVNVGLGITPGSTVLFKLPFDKNHLSVTFYIQPEGPGLARLLCRWMDQYFNPLYSCYGVHELCVRRKGSSLQFRWWITNMRHPNLWLALFFKTWEKMVLFHCAFGALKSRCPLALNIMPDDVVLAGEKRLYQGKIVDDGFEHILTVLEDEKCGGLRLHAAVRNGVLRKCPIWTAFVTYQLSSPNWMERRSRHRIWLRDLYPYVFCQEYNKKHQMKEHGEFEIYFIDEEAADAFEDVFHDSSDVVEVVEMSGANDPGSNESNEGSS